MNKFYMMDNERYAGETQFARDWDKVREQWQEAVEVFEIDPDDESEREAYFNSWKLIDADDIRENPRNFEIDLRDVYDDEIKAFIESVLAEIEED